MQYTWQLALVLVPVYFIKHSSHAISITYIIIMCMHVNIPVIMTRAYRAVFLL